MLGHDILERRILLVIGERDTAHLGLGGDVGDQAPAPSSISSGCAPMKHTLRPKKVISWFILFFSDKTANYLGHNQFAIAIQPTGRRSQ